MREIRLSGPTQELLTEISRLDFLRKLDHSLADQWSAKVERKDARLGEYRSLVRKLVSELRDLRVIEGKCNDWSKEEWARLNSDDLIGYTGVCTSCGAPQDEKCSCDY